MNIQETLYNRLPPAGQNALITAKGIQFAAERYGAEYFRYGRSLPGIHALTRPDLEQLQVAELRRLLQHARGKSAYYRAVLAAISIEDIRSIDDLRAIPILDKESLRARPADFYTQNRFTGIEGHTGGTTGKSLVVVYSRRDFQRRMADLDYFRRMHGGRHGMRRATFSGKHLIPEGRSSSSVFWRNNWTLRQRLYSTFHLAPQNMDAYIDDLNRFKPQIIDGFTTCIVDVCLYIRASGRKLTFHPAAVFPTSEPLYPHQRVIMRETLGVEPRDQYAASEGAPFIVECTRGHLHYWMHTGVIEVDQDGEALVTSFTSYGTPLIRYRIGDRIKFRPHEEYCDCGWQTPLVESIEGRSIDFLWSEERGRIYSPNIANTVKNLPNAVIQAQFTQLSNERIRATLVVDKSKWDPTTHTPIVREELARRLGGKILIDIEVAIELQRTAGGKQPLIINRVARGST